MGVNWDSGVLFWQDHAPSANERYTLSHLHPFVQRIDLAATDKNPARKAKLYVAFGLHTFTRAIEPGDGHHDLYRDNREARTFCRTRYQRSFQLPDIIRTLETRRCEFARGMSGLVNYVTVETTDGERYAAFTSMRCWATCSAGHPRASLPEVRASRPLKRETPLGAGFRHSGSAYLPPGQTSCEAGAHLAGFCAQENYESAPVV